MDGANWHRYKHRGIIVPGGSEIRVTPRERKVRKTIRTKTTTICLSDKARTQRQMKDCTEVECVSIKNDPKRKIHLLSMKMDVCVSVCTCAIFQYNTQFYACIPWGKMGDGRFMQLDY